MGEARRRGTFEERKAQAIAAGRVKKRREARAPSAPAASGLLGAVIAGIMAAGRKQKRHAVKRRSKRKRR